MGSETFGERAIPGHHNRDYFFRYLIGPIATDKGSMEVAGAQHLTGSNPTFSVFCRGVSFKH